MKTRTKWAIVLAVLIALIVVSVVSAHAISKQRTCTWNLYVSGVKKASHTITAYFTWSSTDNVQVVWATSSQWAATGYSWRNIGAISSSSAGSGARASHAADLYQGSTKKFRQWVQVYAVDGSTHGTGCQYGTQ